MTGDEFMDLINEMHVAVLEEAHLFELPLGAIDDPSRSHVVHGPWAAKDCSTVLIQWFDCDWVALYLPGLPGSWGLPAASWEPRLGPGSQRVLSASDARSLLSAPDLWTSERLDGFVCLTTTDEAPRDDPNAWFRDTPWLGAGAPPVD